MVRPDFQKWDQTAEEMRRLSLAAEHPRSRERYQALYMIGSGQKNASQWAQTIQRRKQTVLEWVHRYNELGPSALPYQHSGGRQAKLSEAEKKDHRNRQGEPALRASAPGARLDAEKTAAVGGTANGASDQPDYPQNLAQSGWLELEKEQEGVGQSRPQRTG